MAVVKKKAHRKSSVSRIGIVHQRQVYLLNEGAVLVGKSGRYKIGGRLGTGGFACVYWAKNIQTKLNVAIKISSDLEPDSDGNRRTERELKVLLDCAAKSGNGHVVRVLDHGQCEGRPFFVMERLQPADGLVGSSVCPMGLADGGNDGKFDRHRKLFIRKVLASVAAVHNAGYIHRDIKAENILYRVSSEDEPRPLLVDFGSAVAMDRDDDVPDLEARKADQITGRSQRVSTPGRAPDDQRYRPHWDIFSLGHLIRDMFAEDVPMKWGYVINKCISQNTAYRYPDVKSLLVDIDGLEDISKEAYWEQREKRLIKHREREREIEAAEQVEIDLFKLMKVDDDYSRSGRPVITIDLNREDGRKWFRVNKEMSLLDNTILLIRGRGVLEADITGPASSVVVLSDYAVLHNTTAVCPPENALHYVLTGPGTYLNFPNINDENGRRSFFANSNKRRIFRDMESTTAFRLGGKPGTFKAIEDETVKGIEDSELPEDYKKVLIDYFRGRTYDVNPSWTTLSMTFTINKRVPIAKIRDRRKQWWVKTTVRESRGIKLPLAVQRILRTRGAGVFGLDQLLRYTMVDYRRHCLVTSERPLYFEGGDTIVENGEIRMEGKVGDPWRVPLTIDGDEHDYLLDPGAAYSYVLGLDDGCGTVKTRKDFNVSGQIWRVELSNVKSCFCGVEFNLQCADVNAEISDQKDQPVGVVPVIGFDFFNNFAVIVDKVERTLKWQRLAGR